MSIISSNTGTIVAVRSSALEAEFAMILCLNKKEKEIIRVGSVNGPESIVISVPDDVVEKAMKFPEKAGLSLQVSHSFHSPLM